MTADTVWPTPRTFHTTTIVEAHSGPIDHPNILAGYEALSPGAATTIIDLYAKQVNHRISLEKTVINGDNRRANWGLGVGSTFAFALLGVAGYLVYAGHDAAGTAFIGIDLTGLFGAFLYGTRSRRKEREAKDAAKRGGKPPKLKAS